MAAHFERRAVEASRPERLLVVALLVPSDATFASYFTNPATSLRTGPLIFLLDLTRSRRQLLPFVLRAIFIVVTTFNRLPLHLLLFPLVQCGEGSGRRCRRRRQLAMCRCRRGNCSMCQCWKGDGATCRCRRGYRWLCRCRCRRSQGVMWGCWSRSGMGRCGMGDLELCRCWRRCCRCRRSDKWCRCRSR